LKTYNMVGPRPFPKLSSTLQTIRVTLEAFNPLFTTSTIVPVYSSASITLNSFDESAPYLALFDQYMIEHAEVWLEPAAPQGTTVFSDLVLAVDLDDANAPTSRGQVSSKQQAIETSGGAGVYAAWRPHMAIAAFSGTFTSYSNSPATWIDSASPAVQHYGIKVYASNTPAAMVYQMRYRITVAFRAPGI
jgi:hypothetical protein